MASRVRVAASACLVASGLFIAGAGGAMAIADPGPGYSGPDDGNGGDSIGDIVRRAFSLDGGNEQKASEPSRRPQTRLGNGRQDQNGQGENAPVKKDPSPTRETTKATDTEPADTPTEEDPPTESTPKTTPCPPTETSETPPGLPPPTPPESGGGGAIVPLPRFKPPSVPGMQLPGELGPGQPGVVDAGAGAAAAAAPVGPAVPIALPVIVVPPLALGAGGAGSGGASAGMPPAAPGVKSIFAEPPAGRITPPANAGSNAAVPKSSYRIGYTEYLRSAGLPQVAALAVPGLAGIMVLTGAGGLVGYRQAKAGHAVRVGGSARFMR